MTRSLMPRTAFRQTLSTIAKASFSVIFMPASETRRSFGMTISASTALASSLMPPSAFFLRCEPSKANGLVTTPTVSAPQVARDLGDDRRRAGAGAAAHAGGDEHHVGAGERLGDARGVLERGGAADLRVGAGAEALGQVAARGGP